MRRNILALHNLTVGGEEWAKKGSLISYFGGLPGTCKEEVMGIFGAGELGSFVRSFIRSSSSPFHPNFPTLDSPPAEGDKEQTT